MMNLWHLLAVLAAISGLASSFVVPTQHQRTVSSTSSTSTSLNVKLPKAKAPAKVIPSKPFENEIGATAPLGFYDPLGLVADGNQDKFNRLRYVEIKHGRISMLAVVGYLVGESGTRLPGNIDYSGTTFESIPNGIAALDAIPTSGLIQIIGFIGFLELAVMKDVVDSDIVGDFRNGFIDFGWDVFTPEEQERKRTIEINQGRAAMMGILALMVHEQLGVSILPF